MSRKLLTSLCVLVCLAGCSAGEAVRFDDGPAATQRSAPTSTRSDTPPNILLVIADDVGVDQSACYSRPTTTRAPQPTIQSLCDRGLTFNRAWANPYCSPTRAGILTGRYSTRTGVGEPLGAGAPGLPSDEYTLPQALAAAGTGHATGAFGKWHLSDDDNGGIDHPNLAGFDRFAGTLEGDVDDFFEWPRVVDGELETSTDYVTSATVDDALDWITDQDGPWLAWVAFHAPHWPLHLPPEDLHSYDDLSGDAADIDANRELYYQAMLESVDTELGRLIDGIDPEAMRNTIVIYVGDNGTQGDVNQGAYPANRSKGSVYEGGVHVPLIMAGPGVFGRGRGVPAMVNTVDLFATIIELAGGDLDTAVPDDIELDTVSMLPYLTDPFAPAQRDFVLAETFGTSRSTVRGSQAISDGRHKLVRFVDGTEQLYDLREDPFEEDNLLGGFLSVSRSAAYGTLSELLDEHEIPY